MRLRSSLLLLIAVLSCRVGLAQAGGVFGNWREPSGGIIQVSVCGNDVCARLIGLAPDKPRVDENNPDPSKRSQSLCDLQIGYGFHLDDPNHAEGGRLYDPKSGKTYHGAMSSNGDRLSLRGYVGIKAFGRSEEWARVKDPVPACH